VLDDDLSLRQHGLGASPWSEGPSMKVDSAAEGE
jgi:hypothetical protein